MSDAQESVLERRAGGRHVTAQQLAQALFAPGVRYGWFARDVSAEVRPYGGPAQPPTVDSDWRQSYQVLQAAVGADAAERRRGTFSSFLWLLVPIGVGVVWYLGWKSENPRADTGSGIAQIAAVVAVLEVLVIISQSIRSVRRRREPRRLRAELDERTRYLETELPALQEQWRHSRYAWDEAEWSRVLSERQHRPVGPAEDCRRTDIVGGNHYGWQCLLTTLGSSLLASGSRVEVLDLTERGDAAMLTELCAVTGAASTRTILLPDEATGIDLFDGLDADAITALVVEALAAQTGLRAERLLDQRILDAATHHLRPPITPARLALALRVLLRGAVSADTPARISDEEFDDLQTAFGEDQRASLRERLTLLEATMHPLAKFGTAEAGRRGLFSSDGGEQLHCIALTGTDAEVVNDLLVDLTVQGFIRGVSGWTRREADMAAVILGAERLSPRHVERLNNLSIRLGFRLVLFFGSLTPEVAETAVNDADALGIMRIANHAHAERAASFIGSEYKMVFSSSALSEGRSATFNWGWSSGQSAAGPVNVTSSEQESSGVAEGVNASEEKGYSRVHELVVEPEKIQELGSTALVFVEWTAGARRPPQALDVNPLRSLGP